MQNMQMLKPGMMMPELTMNAHKLAPEYQKGKYNCLMHGVSLYDEWPLIAYSDTFVEGTYDYPLQASMVLCVEALVSPEGSDFQLSWKISF